MSVTLSPAHVDELPMPAHVGFRLSSANMTAETPKKTVVGYYNQFVMLWNKLYGSVDPTCGCRCEAAALIRAREEQEKTHHFLLGLDDEQFGHIRSQIITTEPVPDLHRAYALVVQEERHKSIVRSRDDRTDAVAFAMQRPTPRVPRGDPPHYSCTHCGKDGHSVDHCYQLHGYPPRKGRGRGSPSGRGGGRTAPGGSGSSPRALGRGYGTATGGAHVATNPNALGLTPDQMTRLISMLDPPSAQVTPLRTGETLSKVYPRTHLRMQEVCHQPSISYLKALLQQITTEMAEQTQQPPLPPPPPLAPLLSMDKLPENGTIEIRRSTRVARVPRRPMKKRGTGYPPKATLQRPRAIVTQMPKKTCASTSSGQHLALPKTQPVQQETVEILDEEEAPTTGASDLNPPPNKGKKSRMKKVATSHPSFKRKRGESVPEVQSIEELWVLLGLRLKELCEVGPDAMERFSEDSPSKAARLEMKVREGEQRAWEVNAVILRQKDEMAKLLKATEAVGAKNLELKEENTRLMEEVSHLKEIVEYLDLCFALEPPSSTILTQDGPATSLDLLLSRALTDSSIRR
ncbi:unnamed protein product [Cuscuta campestris]|uniref:CCHC-type domain-containing protein n=1 Tax=Cuscuta campestris TaxID=132261 RepID=A0A484N921_9ASTE|nr:unnamed protein product [Cuscuta campestris]